MYYYIVDGYSESKAKLPSLQEKIKIRLRSLKILGEWHQANSPNDVNDIVNYAINSGCTTLIAVGGKEIFNEVINSAANNNRAAIGFIPVEQCRISRLMNIADWRQACRAIAARKISSYTLIAAGQSHLLSSLELGFDTDFSKNVDIKTTGSIDKIKKMFEGLKQTTLFEPISYTIEADQTYTVSGELFFLRITNQRLRSPSLPDKLVVEVFNKPAKPSSLGRLTWSIFRGDLDTLDRFYDTKFFARELSIRTDPNCTMSADGKIIGRSPIAIRLTDTTIRLITKKTGHGFRHEQPEKIKLGIDLSRIN